MGITTLQENLDFNDIDASGTFTVNAASDELIFTSDQGAGTIDIPDGTYEGDDLATAIQTAMNADTTLTGGVITFAVSYSATTNKFTIDAGAGHTIAYTHAGSDAGLLVGFSDDHSASQTIATDNAEPGDPSDIVETLRAGVEQCIKNTTDNEWESTAYANERYDGTGSSILRLRNIPIATGSRIRISIGTESAIKIKNSSTDMNEAYALITSTSLTLVVVGGANDSSSELAFSTYTTLTGLVTQINAEGNGWTASLNDSNDANILTTDMRLGTVQMQGGRGNTTAQDVYLEMASDPIGGFTVDGDVGIVFYTGGFRKGTLNVGVWYTAGYTAANMPADLKLAVMVWVKSLYSKRDEDGFGVKSFGTGSYRVTYNDVPSEVHEILVNGGYISPLFA